MEIQFSQKTCRCLRQVLGEVRNLEQAQELRLTDGMPDIGRVLCGWGQILQRSREWNGDSVTLTGGMTVWALYAPEDGSSTRCVEGWLPFTASFDLPEAGEGGSMAFSCLTRFVDVRSVSARKLLVRAGIGIRARAWVPGEAAVWMPEEKPEKVELKKVAYPMRLLKAAGEKIFSLEEDLELPGNLPGAEKLVYYTLEPEIQEQRVMGDKIVFRGRGRLHVLYLTPESSLQSWDFSIPFSQYGELETSCSEDARVRLSGAVTSLELERMDDTHLSLRCGLTAQYLVDDLEVLELIEDAYAPGQALETARDTLDLTALLETRRETLPAEATIPVSGDAALDVVFLPDFPRERTREEEIQLLPSGTFQILYRAPDGSCQATQSRWEGELQEQADPACTLEAMPQPAAQPQILMGGGDMKVRTELPLELTAGAAQSLPMVTGLTMGEPLALAEDRPSLVLRRAGETQLWDLAKALGSTVAAIREANHLDREPDPEQMLLIPIL